MLGFVITFALGGLLSLSALSSIGSIFLGNPAPFAVKYTLGNLLSISSSSFLVGPAKQCRDMLAPERAAASLIYFVTLLGTLLCVFVLKVDPLSPLGPNPDPNSNPNPNPYPNPNPNPKPKPNPNPNPDPNPNPNQVMFGLPLMSCIKDKHPWNP